MSRYIFFFILFNLCLCKDYIHIEKSPLTFNFKENTTEFKACIEYNDIIEVDDKVAENTMYFLKIDEQLKVKCLIFSKTQEPSKEELNKDTSNDLCQLDIKLLKDSKLITFPKNIEKDKSIYFLFYIDEEEASEFNLKTTQYTIRRVNVPKPLENKDYIFDLDEGEINIYLMKETKDNYNFLSTHSKFIINIYAYSDQKFVKVGYIGDDNNIFQYNNSVKLDNDYLYIIVDNPKYEVEKVKFSYNPNVHLLMYNANENVEYKLDSELSLLQIYNEENKLLKFNFTPGAHPRVLDDKNEKMVNFVDELYYEYLPSRYYYYQAKSYSLILIKSIEFKSSFSIEVQDLSQTPNEIEMDNFVYFTIQKNDELEFTVKYPGNPIVLKLISAKNGNVKVDDETYTFSRQNQINVIDNKNSETLKIKAISNDLILAVKSKIPEENVIVGEAGTTIKVPENNASTFITIDVNYTDYDYILFYTLYNTRILPTIPEYTSDFGLLSNNELEINDVYNNSGDCIYNLKYYQNKFHPGEEAYDLKKVYYYTNISNNSDITITSINYKEFNYEENEFIKINEKQNYIIPIKQKMRIFIMTEKTCMLNILCSGKSSAIISWNEIGFTITNEYINCYALFENKGYVYIDHYFDDDEFYNFKDIEHNEQTSLKLLNSKFLELSFNYNLSNSSDIQYTFIITDSKNKYSFNNRVNVFDNFYLNNSNEDPEFEISKFKLKDATKNGEIASVKLSVPTKLDIKDKSKNFTYALIAEVSPMKMFHVYRSNDYKYHGEDIVNKEEDDDNTALVIIIIVVVLLVLIILVVTILIIRNLRKKDSDNIDSKVKEKSLAEGIAMNDV